MRILSIGEVLDMKKRHGRIRTLNISKYRTYDYIIISGGDGTIRRVIKVLQDIQHSATFILNPIGSFNVVAKLHKVPKIEQVLHALANDAKLNSQKHRLLYTQRGGLSLLSRKHGRPSAHFSC